MIYRVEIAETAKADLREATRWIRDEVSPAAADRWLAGLLKAANTLQNQPSRCPLAAESEKFPEDIRLLLHGKRHTKYRIIFTIRDDTVVILYVRHTSRDELHP
jgi:plasmid stabilization system protein ParE